MQQIEWAFLSDLISSDLVAESGTLAMASVQSEQKNGFMVEELRVERERSKLDLEQLTNLVDGGEMFTEKRRRMG